MPELPDLQVFSKNLMERAGNRRIASIDVGDRNHVNWPEAAVRDRWVGRQITSILRDGKELFFHSDDEQVFSVHLMLTGRFDLVKRAEVARISHQVIQFSFEEDLSLVISDLQNMCRVTFSPIAKKAPDALGRDFT